MELETDTDVSGASEITRSAVAEAFAAHPDETEDTAPPDEPAERGSTVPAPVEPGEAAPREPAPGPRTLKAPADWRAGAKAHWEKLPPAVQEESIRLHLETKKTLQESADARKEAASWREAYAPHAQFLETAGVTPAQAFGELVGMYARLSNGQPQERVQIVGNLIRQFIGTDEGAITALAADLEGGAASPSVRTAAPAPMNAGVPHAQVEALAQQRAQAIVIESSRRAGLADWAAFEATRPDLLPRVRLELAATVGVLHQQKPGERLTLDDFRRAYDQACRMNPETAEILKQREAAEAAKKARGDAGRRAAAASGIKTEPAGPSAPSKPLTTREQVAMEFARARGRSRV